MWFESAPTITPRSEEVTVQEVPGATLTTFDTGRIPVVKGRPDRFVSGAVYTADGQLVRRSQRIGGWANDHALSFDPPRLPPDPGRVAELEGSWLYGGTWFGHFGHFLTETITTMWSQEPVQGVICHPFWFGRERVAYQLSATRLLGFQRRPSVMGRQRVRVERLLVPDRPYVPNAYVLPEGLRVWDRLREAALRRVPAPGHELVYLSRTAHNDPPRRSRPNDAAVDEMAVGLGFHVVHPEQLTFPEQVALASGARVLAGPSGSALHLSVFAGPDTAVLELADARDWSHPVRTQQILCRARGQRLAWVSLTHGPAGHDVPALAVRLRELLAAV